MQRNFYKCRQCLGVFAIDGQRQRAHCDCGAGELDHMGAVQRDRLVIERDRCACDHRCTDATGPSCNCRCGGENHGTHRTVHVVIDNGAVPRISAPDSLAQRLAVRQEYLTAIEHARARIAQLPFAQDIMERRFVQDKAAWWSVVSEQRAMIKAQGYMVHKMRINAINKIASGVNHG